MFTLIGIIVVVLVIIGIISGLNEWGDLAEFCEMLVIIIAVFGLAAGVAAFIINSSGDNDYIYLDTLHEELVYQMEGYDELSHENQMGLYKKVQTYNVTVEKGKRNQRNFWIGPFVPDIYDNLETINIHEEG